MMIMGRGTREEDHRVGSKQHWRDRKEEEWMNPGEAGREEAHDTDMMGQLEVDDMDCTRKGSHHTLLSFNGIPELV